MEELVKRHTIEVGRVTRHKTAAVLVCLFEKDGDWHVLLTKRSEHLRTYPGQVCFPGGRMDGQETVIETALREAKEEIGMDSNDLSVIGTLSPVVAKPRLFVYPVVALYSGKMDKLHKNEEVALIFSCPLNMFLRENNHTFDDVDWFKGKLRVHYFYWDNSLEMYTMR
jgi:coenzyme A diphosphatase NUDT7